MKELNIEIEESFVNGLYPSDTPPSNLPFLELMQGLQASPDGGVTPSLPDYPIDSPALSMSWPFPQFCRGERVTLLVAETALYTVDESDWSTAQKILYNAATPANSKEISAGGGWHFASRDTDWFLTNGATFIFHLPSNDTDKMLASTDIDVQSVCMGADDRLFLGGLSGSWFGTGSWTALFDAWMETLPPGWYGSEDLALDTSWVVWSKPVYKDIPYYHLMAALGFLGATAYTKWFPEIVSAIERGDMGMAPARARGPVQNLKPIRDGQGVVAYSADGVSVILKTQGGPKDIFVPQLLKGTPGIIDRCAVGGPMDRHIYVANDGNLYELPEATLEPNRLGFPDFVGGLTAAEIIISYDSTEDLVWIADSSMAYVLNADNRLGGPIYYRPTSLFMDEDGNLVGTYEVPEEDDDEHYIWLRTASLDINFRGRKTGKLVKITDRGMTHRRARILYADEFGGTFSNAPWDTVNPEGVAFPTTSFVDGKVEIEGRPADSDVRIHRAEFRYQADDRRYIRGTHGTKG